MTKADYVERYFFNFDKKEDLKKLKNILIPFTKPNPKDFFLIEPTIENVTSDYPAIYLGSLYDSSRLIEVYLYEIYYHSEDKLYGITPSIEISLRRREKLPDFTSDKNFNDHLYILKFENLKKVCYIDDETKKLLSEKFKKSDEK